MILNTEDNPRGRRGVPRCDGKRYSEYIHTCLIHIRSAWAYWSETKTSRSLSHFPQITCTIAPIGRNSILSTRRVATSALRNPVASINDTIISFRSRRYPDHRLLVVQYIWWISSFLRHGFFFAFTFGCSISLNGFLRIVSRLTSQSQNRLIVFIYFLLVSGLSCAPDFCDSFDTSELYASSMIRIEESSDRSCRFEWSINRRI